MTPNRAAADLNRHVVDRSVIRKREAVNCLDFLRGGVFESLGNRYAREESADCAANFGVTERACARHRSVFTDDS